MTGPFGWLQDLLAYHQTRSRANGGHVRHFGFHSAARFLASVIRAAVMISVIPSLPDAMQKLHLQCSQETHMMAIETFCLRNTIKPRPGLCI